MKKESTATIVELFKQLAFIPSPSGYTKDALNFVKNYAENLGYSTSTLRKGGVIIEVSGKTKENTLGLSAHVDTLGAMVRSITPQGTLKLISVGGFLMESIEGSYCQIHTRTGKTYTGTIQTVAPSVHTYDDARRLERVEKNMEVRIDEVIHSKEDVEALEIQPGDFISFDSCFCHTESGFIKSRHIDDKASVAIFLTLLKEMKEQNFIPERPLKILISNYEEVGHGSAFLPNDITDLIAIDMGAIGDDLSGDEYKVSICALDSSGPYDYELTNELIEIAKDKHLDYAIDIFPHYGSDVSAALRGGNNIRGALIGQGVNASHGIERTHEKGLENTFELIKGFLKIQ